MCSRSDCSRRASSTSSFASSNSARGGWSTELLERITDRSTKFSSSRTLPGQWGSDIAFIAEARFLCANRVRDAVERVAGNTVNLPYSCFRENIHQQVCYIFLSHGVSFPREWRKTSPFLGCCGFLSGHTIIKTSIAVVFPSIGISLILGF